MFGAYEMEYPDWGKFSGKSICVCAWTPGRLCVWVDWICESLFLVVSAFESMSRMKSSMPSHLLRDTHHWKDDDRSENKLLSTRNASLKYIFVKNKFGRRQFRVISTNRANASRKVPNKNVYFIDELNELYIRIGLCVYRPTLTRTLYVVRNDNSAVTFVAAAIHAQFFT